MSKDMQKKFIQGSHKYWMLKRLKETIIYDNDTEIYRYNETHRELLKTLSLFADKFDELEEELKKYYTYASSSKYDSNTALNHLRTIDSLLQQVHIFLRTSDNSLIYLRRALYEYFCDMVEYRFANYLTIHSNRNSAITLQSLEAFREEDKKFFNNLQFPIHDLITKRNMMDIYDFLRKNELWEYFQHISHYPNPLEAKVTESDLKKYCYPDYIDYINKNASKLHILKHYKTIINIFIDYFSFFSNIQEYYPKAKPFHSYMLLLSNNHLYTRLIDSCTFYSEHQSMYDLIRKHLTEKDTNGIVFRSRVSLDVTNDIYQYIQNHANDDDNNKERIMEDLLYYYPDELENNIGAQIIEFQFFEQLIANELMDIIKKNIIIKKCPHCERYFITNSKRQKYCDQHKNKHNIQQQNYTKKKRSESLYQTIFSKYNECIRKRKLRKKIPEGDYENWKRDSTNLIPKAEAENMSKDIFIDNLNTICKRNNISPRRKYTASSKKNIG